MKRKEGIISMKNYGSTVRQIRLSKGFSQFPDSPFL